MSGRHCPPKCGKLYSGRQRERRWGEGVGGYDEEEEEEEEGGGERGEREYNIINCGSTFPK